MKTLPIIFLTLITQAVFGQSLWSDETHLYEVEEGNERWQLQITYQNDDSESTIELEDPQTYYLGRFSNSLSPLGHTERTTGPEGTFSTTVEIQELPRIASNEYLVMDTTDLFLYMRNFNFVRDNKANIRFLGQEANSDFSLEVHYIRLEEIDLGRRRVSAHRVELVPILSGAMSIFGGFLPRTILWFSTDSSPYLLKFEGTSGFSGGEKRILTFQSRQSL